MRNCCTRGLTTYALWPNVDEQPRYQYLSCMANSILNRKFRYSYTNATLKLVLVNIIVFMLTTLYAKTYAYLALVPSYIYYKHWYWQFFTYMFTHANLNHILFNMLGLYMFGSAVERRIGSKEFVLFYLLTGTLSGIFSYFSYYLSGTNVVLVGASGAVYAVLFAYAVLYPYARILVFWFFPMRAPLLVAVYTAIELFNQVFGVSGGVAHLTHLAGFGFAFLYFIFRLKIRPLDEWRRSRPYR